MARPGSITTQSLVIITNQSLVSPRLFRRDLNKRVCSREPDFWGTLSRSYFVSHDTMLEQFSVSDRKLGRGDTGVFLSLLLMVYIPHLSHRGSPHHLPSLANCLTFQFCLLCAAPGSESLRCEMVITRRERKPGAWTGAQ